ncbi:MAG: TraB/GumN family protein [Nitrospirales bacterium]|nr:TraB/GumN family protein [Nitrospira sp.]MDR4501057.1 TraB/GumN family protein [Nitrospirales bacterium]
MSQRPNTPKTKSLLFLILIYLLLPDNAHATATSCLWKVSSPSNTVYLLGSVHVLKQENYPLNDTIYAAYDSVAHLVFEANLDDMSSPATQANALSKGLYTDGRTLQKTLSPGNYAVAKTQLERRGYSMTMFNLMKPWMLASTITILELQKLGFGTEFGVDQHFFQKAKREGKTTEGLETVEYQLDLFDQLSDTTQESFLLQTLEEITLLEQQTQQLVDSWTHGKIQGLEVLLTGMQAFPEVYEALITRRNQNWLPRIETYLQHDEPYMIVVGTLHLLGNEGLLAILKEKGYAIQQL